MLKLFTFGTINDLKFESYYGDLKNFLNEYMEGEYSFYQCVNGKLKVQELKSTYPFLAKALQILYDSRKTSPAYKKNFYEFIQKLSYDKIISEIADLPMEKMIDFFNIDKDKIPCDTKSDNVDKSERKWSNRKKIYTDLLDNHIAVSDLHDRPKTLDILHGFYNLRNERNQINHATGKSTRETETLRDMIENYLQKLEQI